MTITVDFFEESIEVSGELRKKTTKHKNIYITILEPRIVRFRKLQYDEI